MHIRHAREEDFPAVLTIEEQNFAAVERIPSDIIAHYLKELWLTCLIMETDDHQLAGYLLSAPTDTNRVSDSIFTEKLTREDSQSYLAISSLSVSPDYKGQGVGTLLLAALKEVCLAQGYEGISLTCKDYLISYYEANGFEDEGISASQFGGKLWYDMYWKAQ